MKYAQWVLHKRRISSLLILLLLMQQRAVWIHWCRLKLNLWGLFVFLIGTSDQNSDYQPFNTYPMWHHDTCNILLDITFNLGEAVQTVALWEPNTWQWLVSGVSALLHPNPFSCCLSVKVCRGVAPEVESCSAYVCGKLRTVFSDVLFTPSMRAKLLDYTKQK